MSTFSSRKAAILDRLDREQASLEEDHQLLCSSVGDFPDDERPPCDCRMARPLGMLAASREFLDDLEAARSAKGFTDDDPCMVLDVMEKMARYSS